MNTKTIIAGGFAASLSLMAHGALANDTKPAGSGPNPFSDCGIGAALFPEHNVAATVSNIIWDLGTTAVTSATASPETCNGVNARAAAFIMESYDNLVEETAQGNGQNLEALMNIMEVAEVERSSVVTGLRTAMAETIADSDYLQLSEQQKAEIYYNGVLSALQQAG